MHFHRETETLGTAFVLIDVLVGFQPQGMLMADNVRIGKMLQDAEKQAAEFKIQYKNVWKLEISKYCKNSADLECLTRLPSNDRKIPIPDPIE